MRGYRGRELQCGYPRSKIAWVKGYQLYFLGRETQSETRRNTQGKSLEKRRLRYYFYRLAFPRSCHFIALSGYHEILFWCLNVFIGDFRLFFIFIFMEFELVCTCL